jgi:hypothetical protein
MEKVWVVREVCFSVGVWKMQGQAFVLGGEAWAGLLISSRFSIICLMILSSILWVIYNN